MANIGLILMVFAFVFAMIAACFVPNYTRWHFGWLALAFFILAQIVGPAGKFLR